MKEITENQFDEQFELITNHLRTSAAWSGCMFETYGEELSFVGSMMHENRVVTIIDGDEAMHCMSGMHFVNRIGYLITEQPITEEFYVSLETVKQ